MNENDWTEIPGRLQNEGFAVSYSRICFDPERPLWRVKAIRDSQEWTTLGKTLAAAFVELDKQTRVAVEDLRKVLVH